MGNSDLIINLKLKRFLNSIQIADASKKLERVDN